MNRIFSQIKSNVGNNVQDTSPEMATLIGVYINNTYVDVLRRANFEIYNYDYDFDTVAGTQDYALPRDFGKELYVVDSTNKCNIPFKSIQQLSQDNSSSLSESGSVSRYSILEKRYNNKPSSASVITARSSNGDDSGDIVYIRGIADNVEQTDTIVLAGTGSVAGTVSLSRIISISKNNVTTGYVTLTSNSGAVTIAVMSPQELDYKRKFVRLFQIPTSVVNIKMPYKVDPLPLYSDGDVPLVDDDILEYGATMLAWRYKRQMAKAAEWQKTYERSIANYIWDKENQINQVKQFSVEPYSRDIY